MISEGAYKPTPPPPDLFSHHPLPAVCPGSTTAEQGNAFPGLHFTMVVQDCTTRQASVRLRTVTGAAFSRLNHCLGRASHGKRVPLNLESEQVPR